MTLKDIRRLPAFSSAIRRTFVLYFTKFRLRACSHGPSATAGLLVIMVFGVTSVQTSRWLLTSLLVVHAWWKCEASIFCNDAGCLSVYSTICRYTGPVENEAIQSYEHCVKHPKCTAFDLWWRLKVGREWDRRRNWVRSVWTTILSLCKQQVWNKGSPNGHNQTSVDS